MGGQYTLPITLHGLEGSYTRAYSVTRLIKLGAPCRMKVLDVTTIRRLNNIRAGKFPVKGKSWPKQEHENTPAFIAGHLQ